MNCSPIKYCLLSAAVFTILLASCRQEKKPDTDGSSPIGKQQLMEVNRVLVRKDRQRISGYLERNQLQMEETATGLWYRINTRGKGPVCEKDRMVTLSYRLSLLDGTECYNSARDGLKTFRIGKGGVESGLEEGVLLLRQGDKAILIIPPHLAYGLSGDGSRIPSRAIIIYEVEVISVE